MPKALVYVNGDLVEFAGGKDGVKNLFTDKESGALIVLRDDGIAEYHHPFTLYRDYKKSE